MKRIHLDFSDVPRYIDLLEFLGYSSDIEESDLEEETIFTDNDFWSDCNSIDFNDDYYEFLVFNVNEIKYIIHRELDKEAIDLINHRIISPY